MRNFRLALATGLATVVVAAHIPASAVTAGSSPTTTAPTFVAGSAAATGQPFQLSPRDAGLAATVTVGQSIADYRDTLAQASSQTLNLGLIGSSLTVQCSALPAPLKPDQLPQPLSAESADGATHAQLLTAGQSSGSTILAAGREVVSASPQPNEAATADYDGGRLQLPGIASLTGLSSHAHAELIPGKARIAEATVDIHGLDLLGGKISLGGLHWAISLRSGAHGSAPKVTRTFTLGSASIAGVALPTVTPAALASTLDALNKALAQTGIHISLPTFTLESGIYAVTPLSIGIDNSPLGGQLLNPVLNLVHTLLDPAMAAVTKAVCTVGSIYTTINLILTGLNGVGALDVLLGGATATSDDTTYANPFGTPTLGGPSTPPTTGTTTPGGGISTGPGNDLGGTPPSLPATSPVPGTNQNPVIAGQALSASCSTTSPAGRPSCSRGAGVAVGLIALATLGGVAAADFLISRRRRKLANMAIAP